MRASGSDACANGPAENRVNLGDLKHGQNENINITGLISVISSAAYNLFTIWKRLVFHVSRKHLVMHFMEAREVVAIYMLYLTIISIVFEHNLR